MLEKTKMSEIRQSKEYLAIKAYYGDKTAQRSGVRLMNHIDEGLLILDTLGATEYAKRAYVIHPMYQSDEALQENLKQAADFDAYVMLLVMEYRRCANTYLCTTNTDYWCASYVRSQLGLILPEVRDMLIADKVQNQKDFKLYHQNTHPRHLELTDYFETWLKILCSQAPSTST